MLCLAPGGGGGTQLWVTRHVPPKRPYFFSLAFTERPPFLPTFTQWPPIFRKFRHFWRNVEKFLAILALKAPIFDAFHWKTPPFLCALSLKDPFFWRNLSPKDPYIWGAWWHSYVTFICEWPPPPPPPPPGFGLEVITETVLPYFEVDSFWGWVFYFYSFGEKKNAEFTILIAVLCQKVEVEIVSCLSKCIESVMK